MHFCSCPKLEPGSANVRHRLHLNGAAKGIIALLDGLRRACQWAGNSATTAMKNYALVKKTDFSDAGSQQDQNGDAKRDAVLAGDARSDAEPVSKASQGIAKTSGKTGVAENDREANRLSVGAEGLEPPTLSV